MMTQIDKEKLYEEVKQITDFSDKDAANLVSMSSLMRNYGEELADYFYGHLHLVTVTKKILNEEPGRTEKLKKTMIIWFNNLFAGNYDMNYANKILDIGSVHVVRKIDQRYILIMYGMVFKFITNVIEKEYIDRPAEVQALSDSLAKILSIDMTLMMESYIDGLVDSTGWSVALLRNLASQSIKSHLNGVSVSS